MNELQDYDASCSPLETLLEDVKFLVASFQACSILFGNRNCNVVTHRLAKVCLECKSCGDVVWKSTRILV